MFHDSVISFCIFVHSIIFYIKIYNKNIRNNYIKHLKFFSSNFLDLVVSNMMIQTDLVFQMVPN